jgi:hypothetical protein
VLLTFIVVCVVGVPCGFVLLAFRVVCVVDVSCGLCC